MKVRYFKTKSRLGVNLTRMFSNMRSELLTARICPIDMPTSPSALAIRSPLGCKMNKI
jgi:hypothetical protein